MTSSLLALTLAAAVLAAAPATPGPRPARPAAPPRVQPPRAQPPAPDAVLAKATAAYRRMRTVRATFEMTISNPLTGSTTRQAGEIMQRQPGRLAIRFTNPAGDHIVSDGRSLWVYTPSSAPGQVVKLAQGAGTANVDLAGQILGAPKGTYVVTGAAAATLAGRATQALQFVPRRENGIFTRATAWFDASDGTLRQVEVTEPTGLVRRILFTRVSPNASIPAAEFTFTPPAGVKVYDQAAITGER